MERAMMPRPRQIDQGMSSSPAMAPMAPVTLIGRERPVCRLSSNWMSLTSRT